MTSKSYWKLAIVGLAALIFTTILVINNKQPSQDNNNNLPMTTIKTITAMEANTLLLENPNNYTIIDVRTPEEYSSGHLANSVNINFYGSDFNTRISELEKGNRYIVYCNSGNRSRAAIGLMQSKGFTNILDIEGGVQAWVSNKLMLTR